MTKTEGSCRKFRLSRERKVGMAAARTPCCRDIFWCYLMRSEIFTKILTSIFSGPASVKVVVVGFLLLMESLLMWEIVPHQKFLPAFQKHVTPGVKYLNERNILAEESDPLFQDTKVKGNSEKYACIYYWYNW